MFVEGALLLILLLFGLEDCSSRGCQLLSSRGSSLNQRQAACHSITVADAGNVHIVLRDHEAGAVFNAIAIAVSRVSCCEATVSESNAKIEKIQTESFNNYLGSATVNVYRDRRSCIVDRLTINDARLTKIPTPIFSRYSASAFVPVIFDLCFPEMNE
jgi:hypothetical protein